MKVGDLVRCTWQPSTSKYVEGVGCIPMKHTIKGEVGLITKILHSKHSSPPRYYVAFPQLGYIHALAHSAFEVINEMGS